MERLCNKLHPSMRLNGECVHWFRQTITHCMDLIDGRSRESLLWKAVKSLVYPQISKDLMATPTTMTVNIQPKHLSMDSCQYLLQDILNDYVEKAPRFSYETATNIVLWHIIILLFFCIMLLATVMCIILLKKSTSAMGTTVKRLTHLDLIFTPENRMKAVTNRSMRLAQKEKQLLHPKRFIKKEEIFNEANIPVMVVNLGSKLKFIDSVVAGLPLTSGRLYRLQNQYLKVKPIERKTENVNKVMNFINTSAYQLHLVLMFDKEPCYEDRLAIEDTPTRIPIDIRYKSSKVATAASTVLEALEDNPILVEDENTEITIPPLSLKHPANKFKPSGIPLSYSMMSGISYCINVPNPSPRLTETSSSSNINASNQRRISKRESNQNPSPTRSQRLSVSPKSSPRISARSLDSTQMHLSREEKPRSSSIQPYVRKSTFIKSQNLTPSTNTPRSNESSSPVSLSRSQSKTRSGSRSPSPRHAIKSPRSNIGSSQNDTHS